MRNKEATAEKIKRAALEVFVEKGVSAATIKDIATGAGISEGALYRHYKSKDELAWSLFLETHTDLAVSQKEAAEANEGLKDQLTAMIKVYCDKADEDWLLYSFHLGAQHYYVDRLNKEHLNPTDTAENILKQAMKNGTIPKRDPVLYTAMITGVLFQPAYHKLHGRLMGPLSDHSDAMAAAVWRVLTE